MQLQKGDFVDRELSTIVRDRDPREVEKGGEKYMLNHRAKKGFSPHTTFP
jgi:hypothetical protein